MFKNYIRHNIQKTLALYSSYLLKCDSVLDVGCGNGEQLQVIKTKFPKMRVQGVDVGDYRWSVNKSVPFDRYDGVSMKYHAHEFDVSLLFFVLHHATDPIAVLRECKRVSKKYVLIYEEVYDNNVQKYLMILYDFAVNFLIFGERISLPKFKAEKEWMEIFRELTVKKVELKRISRKFWYPPRRVLFILHV